MGMHEVFQCCGTVSGPDHDPGVVVYVIALSVPANLKFVTIILLVIVGYPVVNFCFASYFARLFRVAKEGTF